MLARFQLSAPAFLRILHHTRSVIAGSVVLHVLTNATFTPNNLDVYVPASQEDTFLTLISDQTSFRYRAGPLRPQFDRTAKYMYEMEADGLLMNFWVCPGENATVAVLAAPSTCLMNFISSWGIYCAHPNLTLNLQALEIRTRFNGPMHAISFRAKYSERAISHQHDVAAWSQYQNHQCRSSSVCPQTARDLYDNRGLFVKFPAPYKPTGKVVRDTIRYDANHTVLWMLGPCASNKMHARPFAVSHYLDNNMY
ncbi:hypothetical protein B0H11DRAFT_1907054 [Mycena galericulata]|nr:hypothetical protein B0H11DRAFT_1907054 [Mycena galericulata]